MIDLKLSNSFSVQVGEFILFCFFCFPKGALQWLLKRLTKEIYNIHESSSKMYETQTSMI